MSHLGPSPSTTRRVAAALAAGGTARGIGDHITVDGHGSVIHTTRATYEAALRALAAVQKKDSVA